MSAYFRLDEERTVEARSGEPKEIAAFREWVHNSGAEDRAFDLLHAIDTLTAELDAAREAINGVDVSDVIARVIRRPCESASPCGLTGQEAWALYFWGWNEEQAAKMAEADRDRLAACVERVREIAKDYELNRMSADILAALEGT